MVSGILTTDELESFNKLTEEGCLQPGQVSELYFHECNYGEMDDDLKEMIEKASLSYQWNSGAGEEYGPGVQIHDAKSGEIWGFSSDGEHVLLSLDEMGKPEIVARAKAAGNFCKRNRWIVHVWRGGAHELAEMVECGAITEQDAQRFSDRLKKEGLLPA
jgi:hypothetical protein